MIRRMAGGAAFVPAVALVLVLAGWTTGGRQVQPPPRCGPQQTRDQEILTTGAYFEGRAGYARFCGPGIVTISGAGGSVTIRGDRCGRLGRARWLYFGLFSNGSVSREAGRGVSLVLLPGDRGGRVKVVDGLLQPLPDDVGLSGSARVSSDMRSGTFSVITRGLDPGPNRRFTGTWTCGSGGVS